MRKNSKYGQTKKMQKKYLNCDKWNPKNLNQVIKKEKKSHCKFFFLIVTVTKFKNKKFDN